MNTLRQLNSGRHMSDDQIYDVVLQISQMIPDNEFHGVLLTPDSISVDERGNVHCTPISDDVPDLSFCPPEYIAGATIMGPEQYWYSLALLIYWLKKGHSAYDLLPAASHSYLCGKCEPSPMSRIPANTPDLPTAALLDFTNANPALRKKGFRPMMLYVLEHYCGVAQISYAYNGQVLKMDNQTFSADMLELHLSGSLEISGKSYTYEPLTVSYRPGRYSYQVQLKLDTSAQTTAKYYLYTLKNASESVQIGELLGAGFEKAYPIKVDREIAYPLSTIKKDANGITLHKQLQFVLPAIPRTQSALLVIKVQPNSSEVQISVHDMNRRQTLVAPFVLQMR